MVLQRTKSFMKENWIFYLTGAALVLGLKYFYSQADADQLKWILTPTSRWVSILSGISFEYMPHTGFVNHDIRFIIASSCSGVQFMLIAIATLIFSFVHRAGRADGTGHMVKGIRWTALSIVSAYLFTILVNGFRIVLSIYLPDTLEKLGLSYEGWLTPNNLHTLIGTVTY
ncbi:MAG: exosortase K, partial [Lachnospiraceae bacterium]|nr:exosortase K [Lachnospiraceae bacterium]